VRAHRGKDKRGILERVPRFPCEGSFTLHDQELARSKDMSSQQSSVRPVSGMPQTIFRWIAWLLLAAIAFFTLSPIEQRPVTDGPVDFERLAAFVVLGVAFAWSYPLRLIRIILFLVICIGLLEAAQDLVPGRHGRVQDAAVKASGMFLGLALAALTSRRRRIS
jgi:hypothetical protein